MIDSLHEHLVFNSHSTARRIYIERSLAFRIGASPATGVWHDILKLDVLETFFCVAHVHNASNCFRKLYFFRGVSQLDRSVLESSLVVWIGENLVIWCILDDFFSAKSDSKLIHGPVSHSPDS